MSWKKIGKALLFPPVAVMTLLLPVATVLLVFSMVRAGVESPVAIASYVLAAYTLTVWCFRAPALIRTIGRFKRENKYARRWLADERLRVNVSLCASLVGNTAYAVFQLFLGIHHRTFWFYSLAAYYASLAVMRAFLVRHTVRHLPNERMREEYLKYRACGWVFLWMNLALSLMIFFMVYWNRTFLHHEITTIAMAAYTFTSLASAIVSIVRYRKYNSPVYSASKAIGLAAACVSMLTLESTMLTTWGESGDTEFRRIMLLITGIAISLLIIAMAVFMIVRGNRGLKDLKEKYKEKTNGA